MLQWQHIMGLIVKKTPLYDLHIGNGAKMGNFAGYQMPLFYTAGIINEHIHTRKSAGLFDICHMMQIVLEGPQSADALSKLCPVDPANIGIMESKYTFFLNNEAGIIDDLIVTRLGEQSFLLVCNAGRADVDFDHINKTLEPFDATAQKIDRALLALQGPLAVKVLHDNGLEANDLPFMHAKAFENGIHISRSGYTGEDGFEIALANENATSFASSLLEDDRVLPIGLGARDSLRLEAGLSLYGQDLDETTTPMEAGLIWAIPKLLREGGAFIGAAALTEKIAQKRKRKRIGLIPQGKAPVRAGAPLIDASGIQIGTVTSGGFGPTVGHPIALGLVDTDADLSNLQAQVRGKDIAMREAKLPFSQHNYKH